MSESSFEGWAVVEVMGHNQYAGHVKAEEFAGCNFIRVDVPEVNGRPGFSKLLGTASIYAITPCTEAVARRANEQYYRQPLALVDLRPQLQPAGTDEPPDDDDGLDDNGEY